MSSHAKWLREVAAEIAKEGHNGWGNTCLDAAARIEELEREDWRDKAIDSLQRALNFWLPNGAGGPDPLAVRIGDDAMLLFGYTGPTEPDAEAVGWITVNRALGKEPTP